MKPSTPVVSIVIPTRNRLPLLQEALASVQNQTYQDYEVVVVDDASADGTREWLSSVQAPRLKVVTLEISSERSVARNLGATEAAAQYLFFLDDDDLLMPTALEDLVQAANNCSKAVAVAAGWEYFGHWSGRLGWPHRDWEGWAFRDCSYAMPLGGPGVLFRTATFSQTRGFPMNLNQAEDAILAIRISGQGPFAILAKTLYRVRTRASHNWEERGYDRANAMISAEITEWCPPHMRHNLEGLVAGAQSWRRGQKHLRLGERFKASRCFASATLWDPAMLRAPLLRTSVFPGVIRSLLPPRLRTTLRAGKALVHRDLYSSMRNHRACQ